MSAEVRKSIWSDDGSTYAFRCLHILLDYSPYALELGTHAGANANQLDRVAEAHLAFRVHQAIAYELGADLGSLILDLALLAQVCIKCPPYLHGQDASCNRRSHTA